MTMQTYVVQRWTRDSIVAGLVVAAALVIFAFGPLFLAANDVDRLTTLFIYLILAIMWNALAGYGGLVSIGQQGFFGLGAYFAVRFSAFGLNTYVALVLAAIAVGVVAASISAFALRLRAGEFAIGMWVLAELLHLLVNLDGLVQGETGTSLVGLEGFDPARRRAFTYWLALASVVVLCGILLGLLRSRFGVAIQAIRDDEAAATSVGVSVLSTKRIIFILAATGAGLAGALWLATSITFQPHAYFAAQWSAYMVFMVIVGGLGTFEGPILGAFLFFAIEATFGAMGVWYLIGLGATALGFALYAPQGIWGWIEGRTGLRLVPVGYRLVTAPMGGPSSALDEPSLSAPD
jgi:branched-chain amino acid transport system permease protein